MIIASMRRYAFLALILLAVAVFEAWFMGLDSKNFAVRQSSGALTDLYVEGLARGQSNLPVPAALGGPKYQILDASYYENRVYLYFGITPFALLAVPWHLLTGTFISDAACILILSQLGYIFIGCSLLYLLRDDRRATADCLFAAGVLVAVACSGTLSLMARPAIYEIEGACGYACLAGAVATLIVGFGGMTWRKSLLAASALFAGLTLGCRPNCFPAVTLIAAAIGYGAWHSERSLPGKTRALLICLAPLAMIGVGLAIWNYERFSNFFEFGYNFTGFAVQNSDLVRFTPSNLLYNSHRYLLGGFRVSHYFPFIEGVKEGPFAFPSRTHQPVDQLYGGLILFPALIFSFLAPLRLRALGWLLLSAAAANLFYLSGLGFATYRYPTDYLGILSFAAAVGICSTPMISRKRVRAGATWVLIPLLAWSGAACVAQAASIAVTTNLLDLRRPADFLMLSSPFNAVAFRLESLTGSGPRDVRLSLILPKGRFGRTEPILVTGEPGLQDFVYLYYETPDRVEVGFESTGYGGPVSGPLKIDYNQPHTVDISLGGFLPPNGHPILKPLSKGDILTARRLVHVDIDNRTVLEGVAHSHPTYGRFLVGESPDDAAFGARFSGTLLKVEWPLLAETGVYPKWQPSQFGPIVMMFKLRPMPVGSRQPLVSLGYRPAGGILFIETLAGERCRFGWQRYDKDPIYSRSFDCADEMAHKLEFHAGALLPPTTSGMWPSRLSMADRDNLKRLFRCVFDGQETWRLREEVPDVSPLSILVGQNGLLESDIADDLNGAVISVAREDW